MLGGWAVRSMDFSVAGLIGLVVVNTLLKAGRPRSRSIDPGL
jgi:hypothetical protein